MPSSGVAGDEDREGQLPWAGGTDRRAAETLSVMLDVHSEKLLTLHWT